MGVEGQMQPFDRVDTAEPADARPANGPPRTDR
jgi:hypothetical protein